MVWIRMMLSRNSKAALHSEFWGYFLTNYFLYGDLDDKEVVAESFCISCYAYVMVDFS